MRLGLSWDVQDPTEGWSALLEEARYADAIGVESAWVGEVRSGSRGCPVPAGVLTALAATTTSIQLRIAGRTLPLGHPVRVAEQIAVLDLFSAGRAGVCFSSGSDDRERMRGLITFVRACWSDDEIAYADAHVRFPDSDTTTTGLTSADPDAPWLPQWERGAPVPQLLSVTPKPFGTHVPLGIDVVDEEGVAWAAESDVSPFVGADVPADVAVELLHAFGDRRRKARRQPGGVEVILERRIALGEAGGEDPRALAGNADHVVRALRRIKAAARVTHLVWRRTSAQIGNKRDLRTFLSDVHLPLQG